MAPGTETPQPLVLLVDAHVQGRTLYRIVLETAGYAVAEVSNGLEAIHLAHLTRPAAVLLELTLPFLDGLETAEQLKRDEATTSIPVILLTTAGVPSARFGALTRWCDGYLRKPCEPARLLETLGQRAAPRPPLPPSLVAERGDTGRSRRLG
jgi:CheY-like chemotaxis protein